MARPTDSSTTPATAPGGVLGSIRAATSSLAPSDAKVAQLVLANPAGLIHLSVSDAAALAGTSASTVVRACQRLGFRGFHELKLAIAADLGGRQDVPSSVEEGDGPAEILRKTLAADAEAIQESSATVDAAAFARAVEAVATADRVLFVGVGTSAPLAQDAAYRLLTIGVRTEAPADVHVQHVAAALLTPRDVCFAISHTGATRETVASCAAASETGATTVAITSFARSPLTDVVDHVLVAGGRETAHRLEAMASRIAHLCVLDALFVALSLRDRERALRALDTTGDCISDHRF
jgi:DNA-binding MurR/RpiR family transcriptional regulator